MATASKREEIAALIIQKVTAELKEEQHNLPVEITVESVLRIADGEVTPSHKVCDRIRRECERHNICKPAKSSVITAIEAARGGPAPPPMQRGFA